MGNQPLCMVECAVWVATITLAETGMIETMYTTLPPVLEPDFGMVILDDGLDGPYIDRF